LLILFDIDGTLIRSGGAGVEALERAAAELHAIERAMDGISAAGGTDPALIDEIFRRRLGRAPAPGDAEALLERYLAHLPALLAEAGRYRVLSGVTEALDCLEARGATIGLATGNVERGAELKLRPGDLWRRFPFGGFGSDAADRAELVERAIERGERHAGRRFERGREVVVVGDTPKDVAAAHARGATAIGVATGPSAYTADALAAVGADWVMHTLEELPAWLSARGVASG
jgi:phosphoglycolate phosphatase-like HAD superfamily hydrolase